MDTNFDVLPQYMRIAVDLSSKIASGELTEGKRIPGKSSLSSEYNVSQETVRKALHLLSDVGAVAVHEGSGTYVLSRDAAQQYLESISLRREQVNLRDQLRSLFEDYNLLGQRILDISSNLVDSVSSPLPEDQAFPHYEVIVPDTSDKVNMTIGDLRFWQNTGATIVAIRRGQNILLSPGPYTRLQAGDMLIYVGYPESRKAVQQLLITGRTENTMYRIQEQINTAIHMKELSIIAEALGATLGDITDFVAMTKGMTNHSYLFACRGSRYILRIPGEGTFNLIDRRQEAEVYRAIAGTGICDDNVYFNASNGLKVTRFLEGVRTCDPYSEEDIVRAMRLLRHFHSIRLRVGHRFDLFGNIDYYETLWNGTPSEHENYAEVKQNVLSLRPYVEAHATESCLTHIDAVPDNFLFYTQDGEEHLQLIDWEYAGMQDPHVDIAMFCIYSYYDKAQADHLIDLYFDGQCPPGIRTKIYCYIAVCGLLWSNWSEYKRNLGIDYGEYAQRQYRYAEEFYEIARKEILK